MRKNLMRARRKKPLFIIFFVGIFMIGLSVFVGFVLIRSYISNQFGEPVRGLSLTQQFMYSLELFIRGDKLYASNTSEVEDQNFEITPGESVSMVCLRLEQAGLIEDAELFRIYLVYTGLDRVVQAGQFNLNASMSPIQIAEEMLDASPGDAIVSILPGWRIEEIAVNIAGSGLAITAEAFIDTAYAPTESQLALLPISDSSSLEGFLFPGIYPFPREADLNAVIETFIGEFTSQIDSTTIDGFERQGLTPYEAVTLASIIEKEAVVDSEKPIIASVFFNRLAQGMRLETDPTVQYALGFQPETGSWWKSPLAGSDLAVDSPYNTYIIYGLPPTPICNPDLSALQAVAFPAETPYLYFRAACDGSGRHNFAITFEEHLNNSCE